ncbi:hypothetical protein [Legionella bononiensis]|uniref:Riboflavin biosynthesis intermediates N-glycosidase n=1 Tax=Legionella bononiensis TaxID=2793102 RepID=A0ABS1WAD0_9GAMM|nr:hypothetical protein [Legionella bononiensis]MBL7480449.1 hypothetical protein [Legionella bononiensis]MBL7526316.1 hypothetical protein [Legionella bononiensis]MBL7563189.1 hypothetical protein [Legionella bononiensis]
MPLPHLLINNQKIAIFKHFDYFYGSLINTTPLGTFRVPQTVQIHNEVLIFNWNSSEQAYHAQKILHLKNKLSASDPRQNLLTNALWSIHNFSGKTSFLPDDYKNIVDELTQNYPTYFGPNKKEFDRLCDANFHVLHNPAGGSNPVTKEPYTLEFMRTVIRLKLDANPNLKQMAMQLAVEGVLPIEVSRHDYNWASGPDGSGLNMLGILILEEGNRLLAEIGYLPTIADPRLAYSALQKSHRHQLTHDVLEPQQNQLSDAHFAPQIRQDQVPASKHSGYWVCSQGQNRAAYILEGAVFFGIFRKNKQSEWRKADNVNGFADLRYNALITNQAFTSMSQLDWIYNNANPALATKAALFQNGKALVGIFKRNGAQSDWEQSGDLSQFSALQPKRPVPNISRRTDIPSTNLKPSNDMKNINRLINRLNLNFYDHQQMNFWQSKVTSGGTFYKGYTLPHSIAKVLKEIDKLNNSHVSYTDFKTMIETSLKQSSGSLSSQLGLAGFFRSTHVSELRKMAREGTIESFNPTLNR